MIPDVLPRLRNEDGTIRLHTAITMGKIGPEARESIPVLREFTKSESYTTRVYFVCRKQFKIDPAIALTIKYHIFLIAQHYGRKILGAHVYGFRTQCSAALLWSFPCGQKTWLKNSGFGGERRMRPESNRPKPGFDRQ
jgi:hypothetical protein